jgi:hypothetical protein
MSSYDPVQFYNPATDEALYWFEIFMRYYEVDGQLTLQTCFEVGGDPSRGRMFVVAQPVESRL